MVNGYVQNSHKRKDKRTNDYSYNYVDRVRIDRNSFSSDNNRFGPGRGSGWRQKSVSHSDLATLKSSQQQNQHQHHHLRTAKSLDYNNNTKSNNSSSNSNNNSNHNLHELYSPVEPEKDYDDFYDPNYDDESTHQQIEPFDVGNESCSLRRSRSLAVIREETFNDLQITSANERRSQLIPRAKLVNRSFFKERFRHRHHRHCRREEDSTGSGIETQTSETRESDDYYEKLKRLDSVKIFSSNWQNDKSDLESLNSDYFKNSLHQKNQSDSNNSQQQQQQQTKPKERQYKQQRNVRNRKSGNHYHQVYDIEVHHDNSLSSAFPETTTSNSDHSDISCSNPEPEQDEQQQQQQQQEPEKENPIENQTSENLKNSQTVQSDNENPINEIDDEENLSLNTLATGNKTPLPSNEHTSETQDKDTVIEIEIEKDTEEKKNFIAYDSVYLSSEDSTDETIIDNHPDVDGDPKNLEDISIKNNSESVSLLEISIEDTTFDEHHHHHHHQINLDDTRTEEDIKQLNCDNEHDDIDQIYSEITRFKDEDNNSTSSLTKPRILSVAKKLKRFSDYAVPTKRGVLEHLTYISTSRVLKTNDIHIIDTFRPNLIDNQYYSLPDINIGRSLKVSERIDAKLRSSYNFNQIEDDFESSLPVEEKLNQTTEIYDSINQFGRAHKRVRQREYSEIDSLIAAPPTEDIVEEKIKSECKTTPKPLSNSTCNKTQLFNNEKINNNKNKSSSSLEKFEFKLNKSPESNIKTITAINSDIKIDNKDIHKIKESFNNSQNIDVDKSLSSSLSSSDFQINQVTNNFPTTGQQIKIIVTDVHDNVIEEDSIESITLNDETEEADKNFNKIDLKETSIKQQKHFNPPPPPPPPLPAPIRVSIPISTVTVVKAEKKQFVNNKDNQKNCENLLNTPIVTATTKIIEKIHKPKEDQATSICNSLPNNPSKGNIFRARRVRIYSNDIDVKCTKAKMSRPQILHVIDSKRQDSVKQQNNNVQVHPTKKDENAEKEFLEKVDSVKCYWSKLIQEEKNSTANENENNVEERNFVTSVEDEFIEQPKENENKSEKRVPLNNNNDLQSFSPTIEIVELEGQKQATIVKTQDTSQQEFDHVRYKVMKSHLFRNNILARSKKEAQFDGLIQYLQDYSFQELLTNNNVVIIEPVRTKIEQPLQGQPKPDTVPCKITGGSGTDQKSTAVGSSIPKRHFFYHPVRVNRELLEEELPTPDTVRNVRKFFEENVLPKYNQSNSDKKSSKPLITETINPVHKRRALRYLTIDTSYGNGTIGLRKWDSVSLSSGVSSGDLSSPCECEAELKQDDTEHCQHLRRRCHAHREGHHENIKCQGKPSATTTTCAQERTKTDNDDAIKNDQNVDITEGIYSSVENMCEDDMYESYYVSEDILEKIRECGSTVTYYGGRVVDNRSPELNPTTKAIIEEIKGNEKHKCSICQPNDCPHEDEIREKFINKNHLGIKFKLVKSNSCSSRLELVGTDKENINNKLHSHAQQKRSPSPSSYDKNEPEETVRELVQRLENGQINNNSVPRIIESQCIEKIPRTRTSSSVSNNAENNSHENSVTINNHLIDAKANNPLEFVNVIKQVTVNNHINLNPTTSNSQNSNVEKIHRSSLSASLVPSNSSNEQKKVNNLIVVGKTSDSNPQKVCRNKNVDLAFNMKKSETNTKEEITTNTKTQTQTRDIKEDRKSEKIRLSSDTNKTEDNIPQNEKNGFSFSKQNTTNNKTTTTIIPEKVKSIKSNTTTISNHKEFKHSSSNVNTLTNGLHKIYPPSTVGNQIDEKHLNSRQSENGNGKPNQNFDNDDTHRITLKTTNSFTNSQKNITKVSVMTVNEKHSQRENITQRNSISDSINGDNKNTVNLKNVSTKSSKDAIPIIKDALVKHYVANDRKLVENRKYDEIEFEEFEVYDPATAASKLIENTPKNHHLNDNEKFENTNNMKKVEIDNEPYDSLNERL